MGFLLPKPQAATPTPVVIPTEAAAAPPTQQVQGNRPTNRSSQPSFIGEAQSTNTGMNAGGKTLLGQ